MTETPSDSNWHQGSNQTTPLVNVSYDQAFSECQGPCSGPLQGLDESLHLTYPDNTGSALSVDFDYSFYPGGLDVKNHTVLNWSKMQSMWLSVDGQSYLNSTHVMAMYNMLGFYVVNGTASNLSFQLWPEQPGQIGGWYPSGDVGSLSFAGGPATFGEVADREIPYEYQGASLEGSEVDFNVSLMSAFSVSWAPGGSPTASNGFGVDLVPTVLSFQVTHNLSYTGYKYGVQANWSATKAFPVTMPGDPQWRMRTGAPFSLVSEDTVWLATQDQNGSQSALSEEFTTDSGNDTAIYRLDGTILCQEFFTTHYTLDGSPQVLNTTRVYLWNASERSPPSGMGTGRMNVSSVAVAFGGFRYNESTGFAFDPDIVTRCSFLPGGSSSLVWVLVGGALVAVAVVALVLRRRRKRRVRTTAKPPESRSPEAEPTTNDGTTAEATESRVPTP